MRIGIVAGEASGDLLGASLIKAIKERLPTAKFEGIAGPLMQDLGCTSLYPMEKLSITGIFEIVRHLPELLAMRRDLIRYFRESPPDIFIGIDAPEFNLGLELALKAAHIPTVHYVSPSVWAWRQYRVRKIARAVDLMLVLFPFEAQFYEQHQIKTKFVGHPLADMIPMQTDATAARRALGLPLTKKIIALLPGSRTNEVLSLGRDFLQAARLCLDQDHDLHFVAPMVSPKLYDLFSQMLAEIAPSLPLTLVHSRSRETMQAADCVMLASGTATLEAALLRKPMVVAYRFKPLSYWIISRLVKLPYYSLPNLIAQEALVPELIQTELNPERLATAVMTYLKEPGLSLRLQERYQDMHRQLRQDASHQAAAAIVQMVDKRGAK